MIDVISDRLIPLDRVRQMIPGRKNRDALHPETVRQWATSGRRGMVLETVPFGGTICTSEAALRAFIAHLMNARQQPDGPPRKPPVRRNQQSARELVSQQYGI